MSQVIRIPSNIYSRLEQYAEGFDTPANVIEKLLNHYEGIEQGTSKVQFENAATKKRDSTKYSFNNQIYGKGRLVLAVIKEYVSDNSEVSFDILRTKFPKALQGSSGVFSYQEEAQEIYERTGHKRHFLKPDELISLSDCVVAVSTEWGAANINKFIQQARTIGFSITVTNS